MKSAAMLLIKSLSFLLLFAFFFISKPSLASNDREQVLDVNGDAIFPGGEYYIMSGISGAGGGGVKPGSTGESFLCPLSVVQEFSDLQRGVPVRFSIPGRSPGIISSGTTELEIAFTEKPECAESSKWVVVSGSEESYSWVGIGGSRDHPHDELVSGVFKIEKYLFAYKLVFCPPTNNAMNDHCSDIGISYEGGKKRLVLISAGDSFQAPFLVVFLSALQGNAKSII